MTIESSPEIVLANMSDEQRAKVVEKFVRYNPS